MIGKERGKSATSSEREYYVMSPQLRPTRVDGSSSSSTLEFRGEPPYHSIGKWGTCSSYHTAPQYIDEERKLNPGRDNKSHQKYSMYIVREQRTGYENSRICMIPSSRSILPINLFSLSHHPPLRVCSSLSLQHFSLPLSVSSLVFRPFY